MVADIVFWLRDIETEIVCIAAETISCDRLADVVEIVAEKRVEREE